MSYLQRKMFANGGGVGIAPNQVVVGDETFTIDLNRFEQAIRQGLLDGTDLYPIINAPGAQRGSEVQRILNEFARVDEPEIMPGRLASGFFGIPSEERAGTLYAPGDFGSTLQNVGLGLQRYGQSVRNVAADAGNIAARGLGGIADYLTGPDVAGAFGGLKGREEAIQRQAEGQTYMPEGDVFSKVPLMTQDDVARIRLRQLGDIVSLSDTIEQDIETLEKPDVVDTASVEEVSVETPRELPTGTVEIRNISPDDYEGSNIALLKQEMEIVGRDEEGNPLPETRLLQDPEIQDLLDEIKPIELKVDVDKTEADSLMDTELKFEGLKPGELKEGTEEIFESIRPGEDPTKPIAPIMPIGEPAPEKDAVTRKLEQPGFFGSDRFVDFIRNVGGELTRTGQFGTGLSLGASKAAEERAARELMAEQEERDFASKLRLARAEAALEGGGYMDPSDANKIVDQENALADDIQSFEKSRNTLSNLNKVIGILDEGGATGLRGFFGEATDMIEAAIKSDTGKSFEDLNPRTRANSLLKVLRQANVREILGESGKTISNLDRQIVEDVFGDIRFGTPVAVSIKKLKDSRKNILNGMMSTQNKIINSASFFDNIGYTSQSLKINQPILDLIKAFTFANAESYIAPDTSDAGIIDTTL